MSGRSTPSTAESRTTADRKAKLKLVASLTLPVWGRAVVAILGTSILMDALGLSAETGYAVIPGIYLAMAPPVGNLIVRTTTVAVATLFVAVMTALGAEASRWTPAIVAGLGIVAFACGLLPLIGPRAASMQLPVLMGFIYSAAHPLDQAPREARVAAVLASLPVYAVAIAVVFQTDPRLPILRGAAGLLAGISEALESVRTGADDVAADLERGLIQFRVVLGRLKDAAMPLGDSLDARAHRLLARSVQQAAADVQLLATDASHHERDRDSHIQELTMVVRSLAAGLTGSAPLPKRLDLEQLRSSSESEDDLQVAAVAESLTNTTHAVAALRGESADLPPGLLAELPGPLARLRTGMTLDNPTFRRAIRLAIACTAAGLVAELSGLGRTYWAIFTVVIVLNAPAALSGQRAAMRIGGTVLGFLIALPLVALLGGYSNLAGLVGLLLLLPGLMLSPINYATSVTFITCAVAVLYSASGEEADFLRYRILENAIGVSIVIGIGLVLWHTGANDWWMSARSMARSLGEAYRGKAPARWLDELATRMFTLRTETIEVSAIPDTSPAFAASWSYGAGVESLLWILAGRTARSVAQPQAVAERLMAIAAACEPTPPAADLQVTDDASTLEDQELDRMARAINYLHRMLPHEGS